MLTREQIAFYQKNGYLGVPNVLTADEVEALQRVTDEFVEASRLIATHTNVYDLEPDHSATNPRVRRLKEPANHHEVYANAIRNDRILDIVEQLVGPGVRTNGNKLNMKSAGFGSPVEWHQDWAFYPHTNDDLLAVGVCIDEMTLENGALLVIPESHTGPVYNHHQNGRFCGAVNDEAFTSKGEVAITLPAGGISIHHVRTLHGSAPNLSSKPRRLLLFQYAAVDAWPLTSIGDWDSFNKNLLRGEPIWRPRLTAVPVSMPFPPAERGGSIYETQTILEKPVFARKAG